MLPIVAALALTLSLPSDDVAKAAAAAAPVATVAPVASGALPSPDVRLPKLASFGDDVLNRAELIVEGSAEHVASVGRGVGVTRFKVEHVLLGTADDATRKDVVVLSAPSDFAEGASYLLFLTRFRTVSGPSDRYEALGKIASAERDFADKRRVLVDLLKLKTISDPVLRERTLARLLVRNLGDPAVFVKWNALTELRALAPQKKDLFGSAEKARLIEVYKSDPSASLRRELLPVLTALAIEVPGENGA